nr:uncharacterized protein LOC109782775 [Aegilops tauschii subsp. strangulata]
MVAPCPLESLVLYLAATPHSASMALVAIREERQAKSLPHDATHSVGMMQHQDDAPEAMAAPADDQAPQDSAPEAVVAPTGDRAPEVPQPQEVSDSINTFALVEHPVYFVSMVLRDAQARYLMPQKLLLALLVASRKLHQYFQGHPIKVVSVYPLERGAGAGSVLISPTHDKLYYTVQLCFQRGEKVSNNIAEYEDLIADLKAAATLGVKCLTIKGDSQLLVNFSNNVYESKDEHMEGTLPEKEEDAERVAQQAIAYCIQDGELYRKRPNDVSL